jgi:hypothetical protein
MSVPILWSSRSRFCPTARPIPDWDGTAFSIGAEFEQVIVERHGRLDDVVRGVAVSRTATRRQMAGCQSSSWIFTRHYRIIAKLVLTLFALGVLLLQLSGIDQLARAAADSAFDPDTLATLQASLILHASGGLVVVLLALVLSIYKPRGMTRYGVRQMRSAR